MTRIKALTVAALFGAGVCFAIPAAAQFQISQSVIGSGGGNAASTNFAVRGTVSQMTVGRASSANFGANGGYWYNPGTIATGIEDGHTPGLPNAFTLEQNSPNPFNPSTTIRFALPQASRVQITLFDAKGRRVATILNERFPAGFHQTQFDGSNLASGVYLYRLQANGFAHTRKLVLLK